MRYTHTLFTAIIILLLAGHHRATAQITAPFAVGVRGTPDGAGLNLRYFFNQNFALEGQANFSGGTGGGSGQSRTGILLAQFHTFIAGDPRFRFFIGGGAHYGSWVRYKDASLKQNYFGLDLILGPEYVFENIPVGISLDVKPSFNYVSNITTFPNNTFGLTIRFYFGEWEEYDSHIEDKRE